MNIREFKEWAASNHFAHVMTVEERDAEPDPHNPGGAPIIAKTGRIIYTFISALGMAVYLLCDADGKIVNVGEPILEM